MKFIELSVAWQDAFAPFLMSWFRDREMLTHKLLIGELEFYAARLPMSLTPFELAEALLRVLHDHEGQPPPLIQFIENSLIVAQYERANQRSIENLKKLLGIATLYAQQADLINDSPSISQGNHANTTKIFLSYRRNDSGVMAGRICDHLEEAFGNANVDKDTQDILPGRDWRAWIREHVVNCDIMLVLIGEGWLNAQDGHGRRRLDDPDDWVRFEIQTALEIERIRVIPVLLGQMSMPALNLLSEVLRPLIYRQAARVRDDPDFTTDMARLIKSIQM